MEEETFPLLPHPLKPENHEADHILYNIFQDVLSKPSYPENVAKNLSKFNVKTRCLKDSAKQVQMMKEISSLNLEDIKIAEQKLMYAQAKYLKKEEEIKDNIGIKEKRLLLRSRLFEDYDKQDVNKYGLVQETDLFPSIIHRSMDFKINNNDHTCHECPSRIRNDLDWFPCKLKKEKNENQKEELKLPSIVKLPENPYRLNKNPVIFFDYEVNKLYKKKIKLVNTSNVMQSYRIEVRPKLPYFQVLSEDKAVKVSPGMSAEFIITFKSDCYKDMHDLFEINPLTGAQNIIVELSSRREIPNLCILVLNNHIPDTISKESFDLCRSIALNFNIDCGNCFFGESSNVYLIVKNTGGWGKFFFITEENWFSSRLDSYYASNELEVGNFILKPAYFELAHGDFIIVQITFFAEEFGLNLEKLMLMCNNITYETIDVIGDAVKFDEFCISFDEDELFSSDYLFHLLFPDKYQNDEYGEPEISFKYLYKKSPNGNSDESANTYISSTSTESSSDPTISTSSAKEMDLGTPYEAQVIAYLKKTSNNGRWEEGSPDILEDKFFRKFLIYYGICVPFNSSTRKITIFNHCALDIKSHWRVDDSIASTFEISSLKDLDENCVQIIETHHTYLPGNGQSEIEIIVRPNFIEPGYYMLRLSLLAECVPKCAIRNPLNYVLLPNADYSDMENEYYDLLLADFDVVCRIEPVIIEIEPDPIISSYKLSYNEIYDMPFTIRVINEDTELMNCVWVVHNKELEIIPDHFALRRNEKILATVRVHNKGYEKIKGSAELIINDLFRKTVEIFFPVSHPHLKLEFKELNFGVIQTGNSYSRKFLIKNNNYITLNWKLSERLESHQEKINSTEVLVENMPSGDVQLEIILHVQVECEWISYLDLYTCYDDTCNLNATCTFKYTAIKPEVVLHTPMSQCSILCPNEVLFINNTSRYTICMHNLSELKFQYHFEKVHGTNADLVDVIFAPFKGTIHPKGTNKIDVHLTPKCLGSLDNLFVNCVLKFVSPYIYGEYVNPDPITLTILCAVEDIYVKFILPRDGDREEVEIIWPPQMIFDFENYEQFDHYELTEQKGEESENASQNLQSNSSISAPTQLEESLQEPALHEDFDIAKYLDSITNSIEEFTYKSERFEIHEATEGEEEESRITTDGILQAEASLKDYFDDSLIVQKNVIEFKGVPLKTAVKKTITIENLTPLSGNVSAEILNFNATSFKKKRIDLILEKLKMAKNDDWNKMIHRDGILVKVDMGTNDFPPNDKIKLDIWVYATTWGVYADEILIEITNILPFCATILIEVIGLPLEFPILTNTVSKTPTFRFGFIPYKSHHVERRIYIKNISNVPVCVVWHIFMKSVDMDGDPITLLFDIYHPNIEAKEDQDKPFGSLAICHNKCSGAADTDVFMLSPRETYIKPQESFCMNIIFNPKMYITKFKETNIQAYLVGYIQLPPTYKKQPNLYVRKTGSEMPPCYLKILATLELPKLELEMLVGDLLFNIYATEACETEKFVMTKVLIFKNFHKSSATISMEIHDPFEIEYLKTTEYKATQKNQFIIVKPNECLEVKINFSIKYSDLVMLAEALYKEIYDEVCVSKINYEEYTYTLEKHLQIKQKGFIKQNIPMEVVIYFPHIEVPDNIDFGTVFIGNNKSLIFTMYNYTGCPINFTIETDEEFYVDPSNSTIEARKYALGRMDISVTFIPTEYKVYDAFINILTTFPNYVKTISIRGVATHDEKYYKSENC